MINGELALAFDELLRKLWSSVQDEQMIAPRSFKGKLARFAPQFSQKDLLLTENHSNVLELVAFLLGGLHEDLNRVKNKPYMETKDSDECRKNHRARNDSLICGCLPGIMIPFPSGTTSDSKDSVLHSSSKTSLTGNTAAPAGSREPAGSPPNFTRAK
ncbi:hypothetical protein Prudu_014453 [Prunus dulcis]|uniref:Peptidase C19 ubiquitin carboxyl-terminal hydrolase domain-containing protein n=1 Tax=Prunus dulcis TaxID=3755 RepID=A0A4Y1RI28_PRUDU|nr:hypothetical protein Prudu_014453 [Prunus dulcis]